MLPDVDKVEREDEDHRKLAGGDGAGGEVAPGEGGEAEKAHVEKRGVGAAGLPPGEDGEEDDAEGDEYAGGVLDETVDDRAGACDAEDEAEKVAGHVAAGLGGRDIKDTEGDDDEPQGDVDEEDVAPRKRGGQPAAEERADGGHAGHDRAPDTEGDGAIFSTEGGVDDGQRRGQDHGAAEALDGAGSNEEACRSGTRGNETASDEDGDAGEEDAAAAVNIAQLAEGEKEGGEDDGVEARHPLGVGKCEAEGFDDARKGDADDGAVEDNEAQSGGEDAEGDPLLPAHIFT